jgi:cell division protein ZipA
MWSLRWVLFGLGALLIVGVYLWGRGVLRWPGGPAVRRSGRIGPAELDEPVLDSASEPVRASLTHDAADDSGKAAGAAPETERVVTVRLVTKGEPWRSETVVLALRAAGLQHGRYGIFHRMPDSGEREPLFSVANLTEPGSFDLTNLAETTLPGMSFFIVLPGVGDPVARFDGMVATARELALELDGELHDDRGSTWSIQRERYVREQIIQYRYQLERP